jgi:hypothetical protein
MLGYFMHMKRSQHQMTTDHEQEYLLEDAEGNKPLLPDKYKGPSDVTCKVLLLCALFFTCIVHALLFMARLDADTFDLPVTDVPPYHVQLCSNQQVHKSSRYAIVVVVFGNDINYLHGAYKLAVSMYQHMDTAIWNVTDRYLQVTDYRMIHLEEATAAGFTHICYNQPMLGGWYNKFSAWSMPHYEGVLYLDSDILAIGDVTDLLVNGTIALHKSNNTLMWAQHQTEGLSDSGVLLVAPDVTMYTHLLALVLQYPKLHAREQSILNLAFPPNYTNALPMDYKYNTILYEHYNNLSANWLQSASLLHMIHPKPWNLGECYVWWGRLARPICDAWHRAPMRISQIRKPAANGTMVTFKVMERTANITTVFNATKGSANVTNPLKWTKGTTNVTAAFNTTKGTPNVTAAFNTTKGTPMSY